MRRHRQQRLRTVKPGTFSLDFPPVRRRGNIIGHASNIGQAVTRYARLPQGLCVMIAHTIQRIAPPLAGKQLAQQRVPGRGMIAGIGSGTVNQLAHVVEQAAEGCPQGLRMQKITSQIGEQTPFTGKM